MCYRIEYNTAIEWDTVQCNRIKEKKKQNKIEKTIEKNKAVQNEILVKHCTVDQNTLEQNRREQKTASCLKKQFTQK